MACSIEFGAFFQYNLQMAERIEYKRHSEISQIGLIQSDIDNRAVVAVGYCSEELFPPYKDKDQEVRADFILKYFNGIDKSATCDSPLNIDLVDWRARFLDTKVIEVVGAFAEFCVPTAVDAVTRSGLFAYLDSKYIFGEKSSYADFTLGKAVMRGLSRSLRPQCLIIGRERYIFYRSNEVRTPA